MIKLSMKDDAAKTREEKEYDGKAVFVTNWMSRADAADPEPNIYELEISSDFIQPPHFHQSEEFQLIIEGSGTINSESFQAGSLHYAAPYSAYGPFAPGVDGIKYLTIRMSSDRRSFLTATHASEMDGHAQVIKLIQPVDRGDCMNLQSVDSFMAAIDGTAASSGYVRVPPSFEFDDLQSRIPGDKFLFVKSGSIITCGHTLTQWESMYVTGDEEMFTANSGPEGLELIVLQFSPK